MFSKYVSVDVANELIEGGVENLGLGGREREVTVFFSDIAGFTDLSEKLSPENLGKILNTYFEEMSSIILAKRGTIDKFIGDAVMAFWNAPIEQSAHAALACEAAILQRQALENVRAEIRRLGCDAGIDMRIGINTGKAVIGNFGCSNRYDYTALGDSVNLASRLESINKQYGTNLIISQSTFDQLPAGKFLTRELDMITVKGKNEPVRIYELLGFNDLGETEKLKLYKDALSHMRSGEKDTAISEFKKIWDIPSRNFVKKLQEMKKIERYSSALKLYREKKFAEAKILFEAIGDEPSKRFIDRCDEFIKNPPDKEWDSVYRFKTK
jgi:adenylate cyclase